MPRALGFLAPLAVLAAYAPPAFIRERYGIRPLGREDAVTPRALRERAATDPDPRERARAAFEARLRELL